MQTKGVREIDKNQNPFRKNVELPHRYNVFPGLVEYRRRGS